LGSLSDKVPSIQIRLGKDDENLSMVSHTLDCLRYFRDDVPLCTWGVVCLFSLCYECSPNKAALVEAGGIEVLIDTVSRHKDSDVNVVRQGVATLFDVLRESDGGDAGELFFR